MDSLSREIARFAASPALPWAWVLPLAPLPPDAMQNFDAMLDDGERARASSFHFSQDALAYRAAHALARWSLSVRYRYPPREWRFAQGELGRPILALPGTGRDIRLSLSHTQGLVAVALAEDIDIGVDAESMNPNSDLRGIASECFSPSECEQLERTDAGFSSEMERFYAFWTLKEALLKARGLGLNQAPNSFSIDLRTLRVDVPDALAPLHAWNLACRKATPAHLVSVAWDAPRACEPAVMCVMPAGLPAL